ncbi:WD40 repeat domain-containing protein [Streptomyces sp. NPDC059970]|uniref:WD40 repeat domain-containing protein n=1 Tax=Streptomyces sp. NPDC059970 TaxID=3347019 RepID=UPI003680AF2B
MSDDLNVDGVEAVLAGADGRLADPGFLVNADPEEVLALVDAASGPAGRLAGAVYRASAHLHRDAGSGVRRQLLALDAARYGDRGLAARITAVLVEGEPAAPWRVEWATGSMVDRSLWQTLAGHTDGVIGVATGVVDGCPVAVTSSRDGTVRVWDMATGRQVGQPLTGHTRAVIGVATGVVDGCPVAVTSSSDETVRVWDLATGRQVGEPLHEHTDWVTAVATAVVDGCPVAVTGSYDGTVRVWDLTTREQIGEPLQDHFRSDVEAVATAVVDGRPVAVTLTGGGGMVRVWDLTTHEQIGEPLTTHTGLVYGMGVVDDGPVVVTGSGDGTVRVWNLTTRRPIGEPLTGHTGRVRAVATGVMEGRPVAVTGSGDGTVRVWNLITGRPDGPELAFPADVGAVAVTSDGRLVVGFGPEVAVLARR